MNINAAAALACAVLLTGCGTVVRGTTETVIIESEPTDARITTSLGHNCPRSPCSVDVSRRTEFTAYAERTGYHPGSQHIGTQVGGGGAAGLAGNVLVGGVIGIGVDAATGAALDHYPNPALIVLEPIDPTNPETPPSHRPAETAPAATPVS